MSTVPFGDYAGWRLTSVYEPLSLRQNQIIKRLFDIVVASVLAILAIPLAISVALFIFLESRGPVLFVHTRIGKDGRPFRLWKFRSMRADSDEVLGRYLEQHAELLAEWQKSHKLKNDPRITRVGRWLRRSSLDELPQLWNVLNGTMSMIGPRPIVEEEISKYGRAILEYVRVQPGLTGLWQVSGRTDVSYPRRVDLDTVYIRDWTFLRDVKILFKTVEVVLGGHGAY